MWRNVKDNIECHSYSKYISCIVNLKVKLFPLSKVNPQFCIKYFSFNWRPLFRINVIWRNCKYQNPPLCYWRMKNHIKQSWDACGWSCNKKAIYFIICNFLLYWIDPITYVISHYNLTFPPSCSTSHLLQPSQGWACKHCNWEEVLRQKEK